MFPKKYTQKGKIIIGLYLISLLTIVIISSSYILSYVTDQSVQPIPVADGDSENVGDPINTPDEVPSIPDMVPSSNSVDESAEPEPGIVVDTPESSENENGTYSGEDLKILKEAHITLYFDFQSFEVTEEAKASLESFIDVIRAYPDESIVIEGHADGYPNFKNTAMEVELSSNRVKAVYAILVANGLDQSKFVTLNEGVSNPISTKKEERHKNDYVEIYFGDYVIKNINGK